MSKKTKTKKRKNSKNIVDKKAKHLLQFDFKPESIYQVNMRALREHYPDLALAVENSKDDGDFQIVSRGDNPPPNLLCQKGGFYYYDSNEPKQDAAMQIRELNLKNARIAMFLGMGLGYELLYYMQEEASKQNSIHILVIEKDWEIFKRALQSVNLVAAIKNPGVSFLVGEDEKDLYTRLWTYLFEDNRFMFLKAIKPVYHPSSLKLNRDYYLKALKALRDAAAQILLHFGNDPYDSLLGIEHMLANIDEIVSNPGINLLFDKFKGRPGIVVSTGPSLNKNKHLLKGLENKALIVAADASLKVLKAMDFKPHLVVSLERNLPVKALMEGFTADEVEDVYYAVCPVIHPEVFEAYPGPRIIVYRNFDHFKWLGIDKGMLQIKVSAGNMAYKVAEALGCDPIILIGQDLAFSRDGKTHAMGTAGTIEGNQETIHQQGKFDVMGNDGIPITTNAGWYQCIKAYETDLAEYEGNCINSTEGGAYINGTQVMPFKEAIEKYINEDFFPLDSIKKHLVLFTEEDKEKDTGKLMELIGRTVANMKEIVENCKTGLALHEKYKAELGEHLRNPHKINSIRKRLNMIEEEIFTPQRNCSKNYETFQLFFAHVFQSYAINFQIDTNAIPEKYNDKDLARIEVMLRSAEWYAVIGDLASICVNSLLQAEARLESKMEELMNRVM